MFDLRDIRFFRTAKYSIIASNFTQIMKILVTGGTGYIGSHTVVDLQNHGIDVISADNGINSEASVLEGVEALTHKKVKHYHLDLCDTQATHKMFEAEKPDGVIHFAALKAVGESMEIPLEYFRNNLLSLINTMDAAAKNGCKAFVFSSSCTVYGNVETSPVNEDTPLQPAASVYGRTKQMGETIIMDAIAKTGMKAALLRYFNPAGAHPSGLIGESPRQTPQNLVPVITETAIGKRASLEVFGNDYPTRDGSCIRDFVHVCDLAAAHTLAMDYLIHNRSEDLISIFNLGIGQGVTVLEAIAAFESTTGMKLNYSISGRREGDVVAIYSDYTKAQKVLNWQPKYNIEDIMKTAWQWEVNRNKI